jgi:hypothetical protein
MTCALIMLATVRLIAGTAMLRWPGGPRRGAPGQVAGAMRTGL